MLLFVDATWVPVFIVLTSLLHPCYGILGTRSALLLFALAVTDHVLSRLYILVAGQQQPVAGDVLPDGPLVYGLYVAPLAVINQQNVSRASYMHKYGGYYAEIS